MPAPVDKTPVGGTVAYLTPAEFLLRKDVRPTGQLVRDDGETSTESELQSDPVLLAFLKQESGSLESAAVAGARYTAGDLARLVADGTNAGEWLKGVVADLVAHKLTGRRWQAAQDTMEGYQYALDVLKRLREGEIVLPFQEVADASVVDSRDYTQDEWDHLGLVTRNIRAFGVRSTYRPFGR